MKLFVVNASPRMEFGQTHEVLSTFVDGLQSAGGEVDWAVLNRAHIERCVGCFTCYARTPGVCVHRDDMSALVERMRVCDAFVLGTPVYIDGMTTLAKTFMDRLVTAMDPHLIEVDGRVTHALRMRLPRTVFLVSVCGYPEVETFDPLVLQMARFARNFHAVFAGALLRPAAFVLRLERRYPEQVRSVREAVRQAGVELVRNGRVSPAVLSAAAAEICPTRELMEAANAHWDRELARARRRIEPNG
jgi:NAD(P)H-dependent FMN reductase